jgi:hypothetical protein
VKEKKKHDGLYEKQSEKQNDFRIAKLEMEGGYP